MLRSSEHERSVGPDWEPSGANLYGPLYGPSQHAQHMYTVVSGNGPRIFELQAQGHASATRERPL